MDVVYVDDMLKASLTIPFKTRHLVEIGNDCDTYALVDLDTKDVTIGGAPDFELVENGQVYSLENFEALVGRLDRLLEEIKKCVNE